MMFFAPPVCAALVLVMCFAAANISSAQEVIFVDRSATGSDDGSSWADAYTSLQDALHAALGGDQVWIAEGVYHPDDGSGITAGDRNASFDIPGSAEIYGGFVGGETSLEERNWSAHETILSGDLLENDSGVASLDDSLRLDNSRHVVRATNGPILLDGLTISGGSATKDQFPQTGAGLSLRSDAIVRNSRIVNNTAGGGAGVDAWGEQYVFTSVHFEHNIVEGEGGAILTNGGIWRIDYSSFHANSAFVGGAISARQGASIDIIRSEFVKNSSFEAGSIFVKHASVSLVSTIMRGNEAENGGVLVMDKYARVEVVNGLLIGNAAEKCSVVFEWGEGGEDLTIINSTIAFNVSKNDHKALCLHTGVAKLYNSVVWANDASGGKRYI